LADLIDSQAYAWPFSVLAQKQVFGPRAAKSQPIWITFCTHLRNTLVPNKTAIGAWAAPGQTKTTMFFVILVAPQVPYTQQIAAISAANRQSGGDEDGAIVKNSEICSMGGA